MFDKSKTTGTSSFVFWVSLADLWFGGVMFGLGLWLAYVDGANGVARWHSQLIGLLSLVTAGSGIAGMMQTRVPKTLKDQAP